MNPASDCSQVAPRVSKGTCKLEEALPPDVTINAMFTRRTFLNASAAAAAANLASAQPADSPIAALKSRRSEVHPITNEERMARVERAQQLMQEHKLNAIAVDGGTSLLYFSNVNWWNSERLFVMVLPVKGEPFFVAPAFEKDRSLEQIALGPFGKSPHVFTWEENENPYQVVAFALKERGLATGRIGIEERVQYVFAEGIARAIPAATIASATEVTAGCRMIKSPAEIALMRLANSVTLQAYEAAWKSMREGMTQHEFGELVSTAHEKLGFKGGASVQVGEYSALPHGSVKPQMIREGNYSADRWRLRGGTLSIRYQPHVRAWEAGGQDEKSFRHRSSRPERRTCGRAAGCGVRRRGCRCAQGDCGCGIRPRIQILHASRGPRNRDGWPRVAVSHRHQHAAAGWEEHRARGADDVQR